MYKGSGEDEGDRKPRTFNEAERDEYKKQRRMAGSLGSMLAGLGSDRDGRESSGVKSDVNGSSGNNAGSGSTSNSEGQDSVLRSSERNMDMGWSAPPTSWDMAGSSDSVKGQSEPSTSILEGTNVAQTFKEYSKKQEFTSWGEARIMDDELDPEWLACEHEKLDKQFGKGIITVKYATDGTLGYYCELCFSMMNNMKPLQAHCSGMKHLKKKDMYEKSLAVGEPVLLGRKEGANQLGPPPRKLNPKKDNAGPPPRNDWDRYPRDGRDRPPRGDWDRFARDDRDRYARDDRDRYARDDRDRYARDDRDRYARDDRDRYARDDRDRYARDDRDRYPVDDRDPYLRTEQDWEGREPRDELDNYARGEWDRYNAKRDAINQREIYEYRNSPQDYPYQDKRQRLDSNDEYSRDYGERERPPLRAPSPPPLRPSPPTMSSPPKSSLAGGPAALLLTTLSQCSVKNDDDANLASEVIDLLLRSLKQYNQERGEESVANLMEQAEIKLGTAKAIKSAKKVPTKPPMNAVSAALETLRQGSMDNLPKFSSLI